MSEETPEREPSHTAPDDTEGHVKFRATDEPEDDTEGHVRLPAADDDDDTEGHVKLNA